MMYGMNREDRQDVQVVVGHISDDEVESGQHQRPIKEAHLRPRVASHAARSYSVFCPT